MGKRLPRGDLYCRPGRRCLRRPRRLERLLAAVPHVKDGDPLACAVATEAQLIPVVRHAIDDRADSLPAIRPTVEALQLRRPWLESEEAKRGDERHSIT